MGEAASTMKMLSCVGSRGAKIGLKFCEQMNSAPRVPATSSVFSRDGGHIVQHDWHAQHY